MGLAKQLRASASSFDARSFHGANTGSSSSGRNPGSVGWQAPEVLNSLVLQSRGAAGDSVDEVGAGAGAGAMQRRIGTAIGAMSGEDDALLTPATRKTRAVDVWSLGCVMYTVLDVGGHPYGEWFERQSNIIKGSSNLRRLDHLPQAQALIASMITHDPASRPSAERVLEHPFFWADKRRVDFLQVR